MLTLGDIFWLKLEQSILHPYVLVGFEGPDVVIVSKVTTNQAKANFPGNVSLEAGEAGLVKASIVESAHTFKVAKSFLSDCRGTLSPARVAEIRAGISFVDRSFF